MQKRTMVIGGIFGIIIVVFGTLFFLYGRRAPKAPLLTNTVPSQITTPSPVLPKTPSLPPPTLRYQGFTFKEVDSDKDALSDVREQEAGTDPKNPDTDGDGIDDGREVFFFNTDPKNPDTDGDGFTDLDEIKNGNDPKSRKLEELTSPPGSIPVYKK